MTIWSIKGVIYEIGRRTVDSVYLGGDIKGQDEGGSPEDGPMR